jgi:integrase
MLCPRELADDREDVPSASTIGLPRSRLHQSTQEPPVGFLKRPSYTKPLPDDAVIFTGGKNLLARYKLNGEAREALVVEGRDGSRRIQLSVATWHAVYRDQDDVERRVDTKCEDKAKANGVLVGLERKVELIRAGLLTATENQQVSERAKPFSDVLEIFIADRKAKKRDNGYVYELKRMLVNMAAECRWKTLGDVTLDSIESWVADRLVDVGVTTVRRHTDALRALCRWAVRRGRLKADPTIGLELASGELDRRRTRRAYSEDEFARLLAATQARPERDAALIRRGSRKGEIGELKTEVCEKMRLLGRERSLIYRTLLLTGLRLDELRQTRVSQATLEGPSPAIKLDATQAKSRRAQRVELPDVLAAELATWIRERGLGQGDKLLFFPTTSTGSSDWTQSWPGSKCSTTRAGRSTPMHSCTHWRPGWLTTGCRLSSPRRSCGTVIPD